MSVARGVQAVPRVSAKGTPVAAVVVQAAVSAALLVVLASRGVRRVA